MFAPIGSPDRVTPPLDDLPRTDALVLARDGDPWTAARLAEAAERLAAGLVRLGVLPGDRVALHLRGGPEIAAACLACFRLGAVAAPPNLRFKRPELEEVLDRLRPAPTSGSATCFGP